MTNLNTRRAQTWKRLSKRQGALVEERDQVEHRMEVLRQDLRTYDERADRAARIIENLRGLQSRWERWLGNVEQQRANDAQIEHLRAVQAEAQQQKLQIQRTMTQTAWQREGLDVQIEPLNREIRPSKNRLHPLSTI